MSLRPVRLSVSRLMRNIRRGWLRRTRLGGFDPVYYLRRYPDLASLATARQAEDHFLFHGLVEGRFRNALAEEEADCSRYLAPSATFDVIAYRALNPDLRAVLSSDRDYVLHFIRHGRAEGRPATFSQRVADSPPWEPWLSVPEFCALAEDWLSETPKSRTEAIERFASEGIARLTPLAFDLAFDPEFHRTRNRGRGLNASELYRDWLENGLPAGLPCSEEQALRVYLGEEPLPPSFDWSSYARAARLPAGASRLDALSHLFTREENWRRAMPFLGSADGVVRALGRYRNARQQERQTEAMIAEWLRLGNRASNALNELQGETLAALGRDAQAIEVLAAALDSGHASFRTLELAASVCGRLGDYNRALSLLRRHRKTWRHKAAFEQLVSQTIDALFEHASASAHAVLDRADPDDPAAIATMNEQLGAALAAVASAVENLEPAPAPSFPDGEGHVVLLGNENLRQCTHYRIEQKEEQFRAAGIPLRRHREDAPSAFLADLPGARAAIFYRVAATPPVIRAILTAKRMGIPTFYEIDDLLFCPESYPEPYADFANSISLKDWRGLCFGVPLFRFALTLCDRAIASTPALLDRMVPLVREKAGMLVRNGFDSRNLPVILADDLLRKGDRIRIFYGSGTLAHGAAFCDLLAPALARLMDERADVDLVLVGHVPHTSPLDRHEARIMRYPVIASIPNYWALAAACDINVAVLGPGPMADCKSEIKWLEAAASSVPTVASPTATYREVIAEGETGFLARTPEEWHHALAQLCDDAALRRRIGKQARAAALHGYSLSHAKLAWQHALARPKVASSGSRRLRVLVCNVFFDPQSLGGATRVVEDNVAHIARSCSDIELAVFCSDEGFSKPGRVRTTRSGVTTAYRVSIPSEPGVDHTAFSDLALPAFREALDRFRPDLVHFHCIQRLTATIVRECLDRGIPYIVTLHDAWWFSDHQFLIDSDGILRLPAPDPFVGREADPHSSDARLFRRHALGALLKGAAARTTVSDSFAAICRSAGIGDIRVVGNGVSEMRELAPPGRSPSGRLRLAHIGGRSHHKGAHLVEAALRLGNYENLELLMVDGRLAAGERVETRWGATPVTLCGHVPLEQAVELYRTMDVLLAPSCWPESYGLVAREALYFGLWVVASSLGAMGEDVIEGRNGFVIEPTRRELDAVLAHLNENVDSYRQGTALRSSQLRSARQQAEELARLYREIAQRV